MSVVPFTEFCELFTEKPTAILIGSASAGIDEESFVSIAELLKKVKENGVHQVVNNGDLPCLGYGSIANVSVMARKEGIRILTIQSDAGKAEPDTKYFPLATDAACFVDTVYNSNGSVAWCASSDEGKMCGPLGKMVECMKGMEKKPILICFGGGLGSVIEEEIYRLNGCFTYILKTKNVTSDTSSSVKQTEGYHVQCEWNHNFFHPKGKCLCGLKCGDCA